MQVFLAENLRQFRRDRQLTQEQLAEVLGVAVGTVSKWESGSSTPDLSLILELADFFGTSVDVLLGYRQQSTSLADTVARLRSQRAALSIGYLNAAEGDDPAADPAEVRTLTVLTCRFCEGLRRPEAPSRMDKYLAASWACCAILSEQQGLRDQADADLAEARRLADRYDAHPASELGLRLVRPDKLRDALPFDDFGPTAAAGVENLLRENAEECSRLLPLWTGGGSAALPV